MKSRKVCVVAKETMKSAKARGGNVVEVAMDARRIAATRLMWMPGKRPVRVPARMPAMIARAMMIEIIALSVSFLL